MANMFEQPIASQFMNTYVPIPFDAMMKAGQMKQQKYDQTAAAIDQSIQRSEQLNAVSGSPDEMYKKQVVQKMYDLRDQYVGKDLSDPFVYRQLNSDITKGIDKDRIQRMEQNYQNWSTAEQGRRTLALNGKYNSALEKDSPTLYDSAIGVRNYTPRAFKTKDELFQPFYQNVKPESHIVNENGYQIMKDEVSSAKIKAVAAQSAQGLAGTPEGQDIIDLYKQAHPDTKLDDVSILRSEMDDYGKNYVMSNETVLAANLQGSGSGKPTKIPASLDLFKKSGAVVSNIKSERDLRNNIADLQEKAKNGDVTAGVKAQDLQVQLDTHLQQKTSDVHAATQEVLGTVVKKLMSTGKFKTPEEAQTFMQNVIDQNGPSDVIKYRQAGEQLGNIAIGGLSMVEKALDFVGAGAATLMTKDVGSGKPGTSFAETFRKWKESAPHYMDKIGSAGSNRKATDPESIVMEGFKQLDTRASQINKQYKKDLIEGPKGVNTTTEYQNVLNVPMENPNDLAWNLNTDGTKAGLSNIGNIAKDLAINPTDYKILQVDEGSGKGFKDIKDTDKSMKTLKTMFGNNEYAVESVSPSLKMDASTNYAPQVEITYKSTKTADQGKAGFRKKVIASVEDPSQRNGLILDLYKNGNPQAAYILSHPDIAQKIDVTDFSKGVVYHYNTPDGSQEPVVVKGSGKDFTVSYEDYRGKQSEVANGREELKNILYNLALRYAGKNYSGEFKF